MGYKRYYGAVLIAEALKNPFRDPDEIIKAAKAELATDDETKAAS